MMALMLAVLPISAQAAGSVTATHSVISQQSTANGTNVTLNITLNNQSATPLVNVTLEMVDLTLWATPGTNVLNVGNLSAGQTINIAWHIASTAPSYIAGAPLSVLLKALDANGQPVEFSIMSQGSN